MSVVDDIERLGRAVDARAIDRQTAIQELCSTHRLTEIGAGDVLDSWRSARWAHERAINPKSWRSDA